MNPFEGKSSFHVLINDSGQYSLWPDFIDIPIGWQAVFGPSDKAACLEYVSKNWVNQI